MADKNQCPVCLRNPLPHCGGAPACGHGACRSGAAPRLGCSGGATGGGHGDDAQHGAGQAPFVEVRGAAGGLPGWRTRFQVIFPLWLC